MLWGSCIVLKKSSTALDSFFHFTTFNKEVINCLWVFSTKGAIWCSNKFHFMKVIVFLGVSYADFETVAIMFGVSCNFKRKFKYFVPVYFFIWGIIFLHPF